MNIHRAIMSLLVSGLFVSTTIASAQASSTHPFKTLRVVITVDGTAFVGGNRVLPFQGINVTHGPTGVYHVTFQPGTWNDPSTSMACFFVPQVQTLFTSATARVTVYNTFDDGRGGVDVVVSSGTSNVDASVVMVFTSAEC